MTDGFREGDYLLGIAGLALLRSGARRDFDAVDRRRQEMETILTRPAAPPYAQRRDLPEYEPAAGYAGWAASYDEPGNDLVALEGPLVRGLLDDLPPGPVLDAACGTGRHATYLAAAGRDVIGVDASTAMLARAREKLPHADLLRGELEDLPLEDEAVGGVVCALALSHLPRLDAAVSELARVLRPNGRLVISNPHPLATGVLGWRAVFVDECGRRSMIPEHPHSHGDYIAAFAAAGLVVRRLLEPPLTRAQARMRAKAGLAEAFAQALTGLPAVIVWEVERP